MGTIKLSNRLQTIASFVSEGASVADIGTDHGYIPVWLAQNGISKKIVAADINKGPLEHAKRTAAEYGVYDQIAFRLCSGLSFNDSNEYNTVIIAGMGGELITSILESSPWTKENTKLILQPNSKIQDLVEWLIDNGYSVQNVRLVKDAGKYYQIFVVSGGHDSKIHSEAKRMIHHLYFELHDPLLNEYIEQLLNKYKHAEQGMLIARQETIELLRIQSLIRELEEMKKETESWQM